VADVFVSYSRADQPFVRELVERLAREGKEAWVDWEGIPPTATWLDEIYTAIEESGAFLFVISPGSAASKVCRDELAHAEKLGKRIVPVNFRAVDPAELPAALADRNWIAFVDGTRFDESLATLVEALDTDLDWVRQHTLWLGKAREWERNERDRSFLLRGSELRAAESWLTTPGAADKEPPATPLQNEYVLTSRQAATRRQRGFVTAVTIALLVTMLLAFAALLQRNRAISERKTAVSELLASLSIQRLDTDLDTALLLGAAAYDVKRTEAATNALLVGVQRTDRVQSVIRTLPGVVTASDLSGDGRVLAAAGGGQLAVWDLGANSRLAAMSTSGVVEAVALNRDGSAVAVIADARLGFYRIGGAEGLRPWDPGVKNIENPTSLAFSPLGPTLAVGTKDGRVAVVDVARNRQTAITMDRPRDFEGLPMPIRPLAFSADGRQLAAGSPIGTHFVEVREQARYTGLIRLRGVRALGYSGRNALAVVTGDGRLVVVDPVNRRTMCGPSMTGLTSVDAGGRGQLAVAGEDGLVRLAEGPCEEPTDRLDGHGRDIALVRFAGDTSRLVSLGSDAVAVLWSPARSSLVQRVRVPGELSSDVAWGAEASELVVANETGVWMIHPGVEPRRLEGSPSRVSALARASGSPVLAASGDDAIGVWRGADYAPDPAPPDRSQPGVSIALSSDGNTLAAGTAGPDVDVLDLGGARGSKRLNTGASGYATALAFDAAGDVLAAGDNTGTVVVWRLDGEPTPAVLTKSETGSKVESLAFAPSETLLAIGWSDGRLTLWDLDEDREIPLPTRQGSLSDLAFSATEEQLISVDATGVLYVWDVDAARALGQAFDTGSKTSAALDTSTSSGVLAAIPSYGSIALVQPTLWDADAAAARVCAIVGRSLTEAERQTLVSGLEIPQTCG
jgi:WD40 repeat protein